MCTPYFSQTPVVPAAYGISLAGDRRMFLRMTAIATLTPWTINAFAAPPSDRDAPAPHGMSPAEALERLMQGNARYVANQPKQKDFSAGRAARSNVQFPIAAILSCADSRLSPEFAFDQDPGELFVTRVAGNFMSPSVLSSLEYAVAVLGVPLIMVLGHSNCGAVSAAIKSFETKNILPGTMQDLVTAIAPAVVRAKDGTTSNLLDRSILENVKLQKLLMETRPSLVQSMVNDKKINIVGGVYDLATGKVSLV
ncbi:MAG: carbonic anhydrase [Pirellulales bacterium]|nr:carbonic anhydrase [Planctomycetia bacterium]MDO7679015.1 carbonic anhydrase [Pirellulales bacterium]